MKTTLKVSFLALALTISLTSCDLFSNHHDSNPIDSPKKDSLIEDSLKTTPLKADTTLNPVDSTKK